MLVLACLAECRPARPDYFGQHELSGQLGQLARPASLASQVAGPVLAGLAGPAQD